MSGTPRVLSPSGVAPAIALISAGEFVMGSENGLPNERPLHRVYLDIFGLATTAVTRADYLRFLEATRHPAPPFFDEPAFADPRQPIVGPSWFDAAAYCHWLSDVSGRHFRLPTEAEREKAARGGFDGRQYPWGDQLPADHAGGRSSPLGRVAEDEPNGYGLHEMAALVHEWCADWSDAGYYAHSPLRNPAGPSEGTRRIARGGSWRHAVRFTRCAARSSLPPDRHFSDFGFRVAETLAQAPQVD